MTTTPQTEDQILRIDRTFDCTIEQMWEAWTDPEQYAKWISPFPGIDAEIHEFEARVGGRVHFTMIDAQGKRYPSEVGTFEVLDRPREIVLYQPPNHERDDIFRGHAQRMKAKFEPAGADRTRLLFETNLPPTFPIESARGGFGSCFNKLADHLAERRKASA